MAKFTRKEIEVADILLNLIHLIPRYHRRNRKPAFPAWNTKKKRSSTRRSRFAGTNKPSICSSKSHLFPKNVAFSPSPDSPLVFVPENSSKCIDLDKNPDDVEPGGLDRGFKDGIFMDGKRNSENGVPLDGEFCKKRDKEESMITHRKKKKKKNSEKGVSLDGECCKKKKKEESLITLRKKKKKNKNSENGNPLDGECCMKRNREE